MTVKDGSFYLGKLYDMGEGRLLDEVLRYDPANLTTHAVVTGMTGSGKTGLCVGLLEEAAVEGIPAIIIDPKGDLTNLLLHFPELRPGDFEPWIDPDAARREGKELAEAARDTAESWRNGLAGWGLGPEQIRLLMDSVEFGLFTPGSTAGTPINILSSFAAPEIAWEEHVELLRDDISTTATALLGLIGFTEIDPLRSREHILLSSILESAWSQGQSLTLTELILQTQNPPFERLGAFPVDNFYPAKDRLDLAMQLNSFLASPSFEVWRQGQALEIGQLLYGPTGKPRHNIFYLAHLNENERMFFVTLLFAAIEAWMRSQRGTGSLRALIYFDEILGYLPPVANPPSRPILLRMLKQARAFGVGLLLATQNPIDVDYRGLSNAGTWMIGRLQTERDKARLLDGLDAAGGGLDRQEVDRIISALGKRTFFLHNVHAKAPKIFQTRWVMNYLAGPLMRTQIPQLMQLPGVVAPGAVAQPPHPGAEAPTAAAKREQEPEPAATPLAGSSTRPTPPSGVEEYVIPNDLPFGQALAQAGLPTGAEVTRQGILYRPGLLAQAEVTYNSRKYKIELRRRFASLPLEPRGRSVVWDDFVWRAYQPSELHQPPLPDARFAALPAWLSDGRQFTALKRDFAEWVYRVAPVEVRVHEGLKVYAGPDTSLEAFEAQCQEAAAEARQQEIDRAEKAHDKKLDDLERRIQRQQMSIEAKESELSQRRVEEVGRGAEMLLSLLGGRKRTLSTALTRRRMTSQAKAELQKREAELDMLEKQLEEIEADHKAALERIHAQWDEIATEHTTAPLAPYKKDIFVDQFGVAWLPYYLVTVKGQTRELPAFRQPD